MICTRWTPSRNAPNPERLSGRTSLTVIARMVVPSTICAARRTGGSADGGGSIDAAPPIALTPGSRSISIRSAAWLAASRPGWLTSIRLLQSNVPRLLEILLRVGAECRQSVRRADPRHDRHFFRHDARNVLVLRYCDHRDEVPFAGHRVHLRDALDSRQLRRALRDPLGLGLNEYNGGDHEIRLVGERFSVSFRRHARGAREPIL